MDDDVLIHVYRESWDAFLEAYKDMIDRNKALTNLADHMCDKMGKWGNEEEAESFRQELEKTREL